MRLLPLFVVTGLVAACAPPDREIRLERLAAERRNLEATFDHLEDRLMVNQARVRFWQEMRDRHESVAAIACASLDQHAGAMTSREVPSLHRSRVASSRPVPAERVAASAAKRR